MSSPSRATLTPATAAAAIVEGYWRDALRTRQGAAVDPGSVQVIAVAEPLPAVHVVFFEALSMDQDDETPYRFHTLLEPAPQGGWILPAGTGGAGLAANENWLATVQSGESEGLPASNQLRGPFAIVTGYFDQATLDLVQAVDVDYRDGRQPTVLTRAGFVGLHPGNNGRPQAVTVTKGDGERVQWPLGR